MTNPCDAPFPAITDLGTTTQITIDTALIPYLVNAVSTLTNPALYCGDIEDVRETTGAFEDLIIAMSQAL